MSHRGSPQAVRQSAYDQTPRAHTMKQRELSSTNCPPGALPAVCIPRTAVILTFVRLYTQGVPQRAGVHTGKRGAPTASW